MKRTGFTVGVLLLGLVIVVDAPGDWSNEAWSVAGIGLLMGVWWMTEAIPIPATALLPIILFPVMGVSVISEAAAPYAHPLIFLFLGGFLIAEAVQRSGLHERIALFILKRTGDSVHGAVAGFMAATAFLSMWVSNTATTIMMLPIALSVLSMTGMKSEEPESDSSLSTYLLLAIAYSATIGGISTLVGTAPNTFMAAFLADTYDIEIGFGAWMMVGVPVALAGLPVTYLILKRLFGQNVPDSFGQGKSFFEDRFAALGAWSKSEIRVALIFVLVALAWITRPLLMHYVTGLTDSGIALGGALLLFMIPSGAIKGHRLLSWRDTRNLPWGVLLLFGGGLSLARAVTATGLATRIGEALASVDPGSFLIVVGMFVTIIILMTEMTSNTAAAAAFLPIAGAVAISLGIDPLVLVVPTTMAASCAFMLPVATPPNAIVFGSGKIPLASMIRAGVWLNLVFAIGISLFAMILPVLLSS